MDNVGKDVFACVYSAPNRAKLYQHIVDYNRLVACLAGSFGAQISVCNPLDCAENVAVFTAILATDLEHFPNSAFVSIQHLSSRARWNGKP